jgi:hypothetical protein
VAALRLTLDALLQLFLGERDRLRGWRDGFRRRVLVRRSLLQVGDAMATAAGIPQT